MHVFIYMSVRQTDRHTCMLIAILRTPTRGKVIKCINYRTANLLIICHYGDVPMTDEMVIVLFFLYVACWRPTCSIVVIDCVIVINF